LLTFDEFGNKVAAHGPEWKRKYGLVLKQFVEHKIFPADIEKGLRDSLKNPAASSCAEDGLLRVLRKYDSKQTHHRLLEELATGSVFRIHDGRMFKKGIKLRKRFQCEEVGSKRIYLFSPVYEVEMIDNSE
jgi:SprT protein